MSEYDVEYKITIEGDNPLEVAEEAENILNNMLYRPHFYLRNRKTGEKFEVDLEKGTVNAV